MNPNSADSIESMTNEDLIQKLYALQVKQEKLESENKELRRIKLALDLERARYFEIYDLAPVGYLTLSDKGLLLQANTNACELLGLPKSGLIVKPFQRYISAEDQGTYAQFFKMLLESKLPHSIQLRMVNQEGKEFWTNLAGAIETDQDSGNSIRIILTDISSKKLNEASLQLSHERQEVALSGADLGLWDWNGKTGEVLFDARWVSMLGYQIGEIDPTVKALFNLMHPDDVAKTQALLESHLTDQNSTYATEYRMRHKEGHWIWIRARGRILQRDKNGSPIGMTGTHMDISEQKLTEANLILALEEAKKATRTKSEFLASMSHEIRTPMNGVLGLVQLLEDTPLDTIQTDLVKTIKTTGDALLVILNDILDFSKMESGKLEIERHSFQPHLVMDEINKVMTASALAKDNVLKVVYENEIPQYLISDAGRLRQIIFNLVGNAIKFTHQGRVTLSLIWLNGNLKVSIKDSGIGIPKSKQNLVFKSFSQADSSTARKFGGTGLGLAISKRLAELMGGEIGFESEDGKGSCFWFKLPMEIDTMTRESQSRLVSTPIQAATKFTEPVYNFPNLRVLVVEDNVVNQLVVKGMLKKLGCQIEIAKNGLEAVDLAFKTDFDLILMDCHMPEMDGFEATQEIRRREKAGAGTENIPGKHRFIVALTANAMHDNEAHCLECGMDAFLAKPFKAESLQKIISQMVRA